MLKRFSKGMSSYIRESTAVAIDRRGDTLEASLEFRRFLVAGRCGMESLATHRRRTVGLALCAGQSQGRYSCSKYGWVRIAAEDTFRRAARTSIIKRDYF